MVITTEHVYTGKHDVMTKCVQFIKLPIFIPYLMSCIFPTTFKNDPLRIGILFAHN